MGLNYIIQEIMKYDISRYLKTLELDKILEMLSEQASLEDSHETARNLMPDTDLDSVKAKLQKTGERHDGKSSK